MNISNFLPYLLPLIGVVVGAFLQHWLTRSSRAQDRMLEARTQAYADFISASARLTRTPKSDKEVRTKILGELADAKYRICIYGSDVVINALAEFEDIRTDRSSGENKERFLKLCIAMRIDARVSKSQNLHDMQIAIFGEIKPK